MPTAGQIIKAATAPGFIVGKQTVTADSSTFTTSETVVATVTASLISGVIYRVRFTGGWQSSVADGQVNTRIREDNVSGLIGQARVIVAATSTGSFFHPFVLEFDYTASATGSKTFVGTGVRLSGTGNISLDASTSNPAYISVEVIS